MEDMVATVEDQDVSPPRHSIGLHRIMQAGLVMG